MHEDFHRRQVLITCEHASNLVPRELDGLGLPARVFAQHVAWDPGALEVARLLARALGAPLHRGRWSRLVADLNRSADHPRVVPRRVLGRVVPGNQLDASGLRRRLDRFWTPYREAVERDAARLVRSTGACLHLSVHSFAPRVGDSVRDNDVGLLYDPKRPRERAGVDALFLALRSCGVTVRRNFPYFGTTDGLTSHLRRRHGAGRYAGIEVELNQRRSTTAVGRRRLGEALRGALLSLLPP